VLQSDVCCRVMCVASVLQSVLQSDVCCKCVASVLQVCCECVAE